jgi:phosphatidate cytidylyltransferase
MSPRLVTGAFYLAGWLVLALAGGWLLTLAVCALCLVALVELRWVAARRRVRLAVEVAYPISVAFVCAAHRFANDPDNFGLAVVGLLLLAVLADFALHLSAGLRSPTAGVTLTVFGCVWCGLLPSALVLLRHYQVDPAAAALGLAMPLGERLLLFLLGVTMLSDVAAMVVGKTMGQHPFDTTVSPKKTVEGLVGGIVGAVLAALLCGWLLNIGPAPTAGGDPHLLARAALWHRVVLGLLLGGFGQLGDFGASIFKREAEVKDYGWMFPGHGGVLDRLDSLIINAPLLYLYVKCAL